MKRLTAVALSLSLVFGTNVARAQEPRNAPDGGVLGCVEMIRELQAFWRNGGSIDIIGLGGIVASGVTALVSWEMTGRAETRVFDFLHREFTTRSSYRTDVFASETIRKVTWKAAGSATGPGSVVVEFRFEPTSVAGGSPVEGNLFAREYTLLDEGTWNEGRALSGKVARLKWVSRASLWVGVIIAGATLSYLGYSLYQLSDVGVTEDDVRLARVTNAFKYDLTDLDLTDPDAYSQIPAPLLLLAGDPDVQTAVAELFGAVVVAANLPEEG